MSAAAFEAELEARRQAERAMRLLARPGAVIEARETGYGVRLGANRRRAVMLSLDEAAFRVLAREATLKPRAQGGWTLVLSLRHLPLVGYTFYFVFLEIQDRHFPGKQNACGMHQRE